MVALSRNLKNQNLKQLRHNRSQVFQILGVLSLEHSTGVLHTLSTVSRIASMISLELVELHDSYDRAGWSSFGPPPTSIHGRQLSARPFIMLALQLL